MTAGVFSPGMFAMDVNDDGNLDLVFANGHPDVLFPSPQNITVMFGNGDGTFRAAVANTLTHDANTIVTADFNGDGIPDVVVGSQYGSAASVLLGQSGGTLSAPSALPLTGFADLFWMGAMDVNGDGKPDVVATSIKSVYTWLGKGDGTFQSPITNSVNVTPIVLGNGSLADLNGDGQADLVAT